MIHKERTMAESAIDDVTKVLKDALYVTVGMGVIAFQKAQVQRQELQKQLRSQWGDARDQFDKLGGTIDDRMKAVEDRLNDVEQQVDDLVDQFQDRLPEPAADVVRQIRRTTKDVRSQVRELVRSNGRAA
jgi:gas vesicle protein